MKSLILACLLAVCPEWLTATLSPGNGNSVLLAVESTTGAGFFAPAPPDLGGSTTKGAHITVSIDDPSNPTDPWVITTDQGAGETDVEFILRTRKLHAAVRKVLGVKGESP